MGLPDGEEIIMLAFFVLTQYQRVTDRWTDRQTWSFQQRNTTRYWWCGALEIV